MRELHSTLRRQSGDKAKQATEPSQTITSILSLL